MQRAPIGIAVTVVLMAGSLETASSAPSTRDDPLHSPACLAALKSLQAEETGLSGGSPRGTPHPGLVAARRQAAVACLASRADPPPAPQRLAQPPVAVAPVAPVSISPPRGTISAAPALPARGTAVPSPAAPPPAPTTILSCDVVGCWANDGSRLNRVGPNLWGPRGACSVQGSLLQCP